MEDGLGPLVPCSIGRGGSCLGMKEACAAGMQSLRVEKRGRGALVAELPHVVAVDNLYQSGGSQSRGRAT